MADYCAVDAIVASGRVQACGQMLANSVNRSLWPSTPATAAGGVAAAAAGGAFAIDIYFYI